MADFSQWQVTGRSMGMFPQPDEAAHKTEFLRSLIWKRFTDSLLVGLLVAAVLYAKILVPLVYPVNQLEGKNMLIVCSPLALHWLFTTFGYCYIRSWSFRKEQRGDRAEEAARKKSIQLEADIEATRNGPPADTSGW